MDTQLVTVTVDMEVSAGGVVELHINEFTPLPLSQPLDLHQRKQYQFVIEAGAITLLRLDPTDEGTATVRLYGIDVAVGGKSIHRFAPIDLAAWVHNGLERIPSTEAYAFRATTIDPILYAPVEIDLPAISPLRRLARIVAFERSVLAAYIGVPLLAVLAGRRGERLLLAVVSTSVLLLVPLLLKFFASLPFPPPGVKIALSRAAFRGLSAAPGQAALLIALAISATTAVVLGGRARRRTNTVSGRPAHRSGAPMLWASLLGLTALAVITAPDLQGTLSLLRTTVYPPQWDADNLNYWAYLTARGDLPYRDYWYTYGGHYLFELSWPAGPALRWAAEFLLYAVFLVGLWALAPQRQLGAAIGVFVLLVAARVGLTPLWHRYLIGIDVIVVYLVLAAAPRIQPLHVCWAVVTLATGIVVELVQVLYAAPAIVAAWMLDCASAQPRTWADCRRKSIAPVVLLASGLSVVLLLTPIVAATGQLTGLVEFYSTLADQVSVVTLPTDLNGFGWRLFDMQLAVLWWPIVASSLGVYLRIRARLPSERLSGLSLLALGVLAFVTLQKHVLRPFEYQQWVYPVATLIVQSVLLPWPLHVIGRVALGVLAGILGAAIAVHGHTSSVIDLAIRGPQRAVGAISVLLDPVGNSLANAERFAPSRFRDHVLERELVEALRTRVGSMPTLFSLTDSPILYRFTDQPAVWHSNMYNASSVSEQARIVRWLQSGAVDYVVLQRHRLEIDGVPLALRVPIVLKAVIELFTPDSHVGSYEVLRRRSSSESIDLGTWAKWLGSTLNLRYLPSLIDIDDRSHCTVAACDQYVIVNLPEADVNQSATVDVTVDGLPFKLTFATTAGRTRYVIPLSRLWFWREPLPLETALLRANHDGYAWSGISLARVPTRLY